MKNLTEKARRELAEEAAKLEAKILLLDHQKRIQVPIYEEWVGVGLLERDDELRRVR